MEDISEVLFKHYQDNISGHIDPIDYEEDVQRFVFISRLLRKHEKTGTTNVKLLINHMIILHNCFGTTATEVLIHYIDEDLLSRLNAVLKVFHRLPPGFEGFFHQGLYDTINKELDNG